MRYYSVLKGKLLVRGAIVKIVNIAPPFFLTLRLTNPAVIALDTIIVMAHKSSTRDIPFLAEELRQKITKTVLEGE
jgi:hypothetical protein